jgi:hypothetical protein
MLTDGELMTGIAEALNARGVTPTGFTPPPACRHPNSCHRHGECMYIGCPAAPNARGVTRNLCPCGSGQLGYNLFNHKRELLMYCCFTCEKDRRVTTG